MFLGNYLVLGVVNLTFLPVNPLGPTVCALLEGGTLDVCIPDARLVLDDRAGCTCSPDAVYVNGSSVTGKGIILYDQ